MKRTEQRAERTDLKIRDESQNCGAVRKNISELMVICKNARATKGLNNSVQEKKVCERCHKYCDKIVRVLV